MILGTVTEWFSTPQDKVPSNDNRAITGDLCRDIGYLKSKWRTSERQFEIFVNSLGPFAQDAIASVQKRANAMLLDGRIVKADMVLTAVCMGLCNALFSFLNQLPQEETIFVLEEIARRTDEIVTMRK